ncbi:MAG: hypothetical protein ABW250_11535 [Pyrinomonadaceae bacterium]
MAAQPNFSNRFVRKTQLAANEYHKNFFKLDAELIAAITSAEADKVTPLMSKIYLRLVNAPHRYWEREGVLRFEAEFREAGQVKAWDLLCETVGVASATANKAIAWLRYKGIIGYFAGKNGAGLRIFLNRASSSIGVRAASSGQKILRLAPASSGRGHASLDEAAFNDSFAVSESLDTDINPHAPKNGADTNPVDKTPPEQNRHLDTQARAEREGREVGSPSQRPGVVLVDEVVARLKNELEPCVRGAATRAAAETAAREMARTREWFETKALPKAVRVAQHETYYLLRKHGVADEQAQRARAGLEVGRASSDSYMPPAAHKLSPEEIRETAETCVALLEAQGKSIDVTLSESSSESGGWLLPEDALRVREAAQSLLCERAERK